MAVGLPLKTTYANGDVYSASDVNDTNGTVNLLTSSTLSSQAGKNPVINGGFDIWQRGTSVAGGNNSTTFCADRWNAYRGTAGSTFSRQVTGDTTNLPNIQYCLRVARDNANAGTGIIITSTSVETINSIPYAGQTVTVSFYARRGANYSSTSNLINYELGTGTGTDQNILLPYTGVVTTSGTKTLTTTWQRFTFTATLGATATEMGLKFYFTPTGTAGAADYFEITGVQVELGLTATTFSRAGGTIQGELAACQRYYYAMTSNSTGGYSSFGVGAYYATTNCYVTMYMPVEMRVSPTQGGSGAFVILDAGTIRSVSAINADQVTNRRFVAYAVTGATTAGRAAWLASDNNTTAVLTFSSEL